MFIPTLTKINVKSLKKHLFTKKRRSVKPPAKITSHPKKERERGGERRGHKHFLHESARARDAGARLMKLNRRGRAVAGKFIKPPRGRRGGGSIYFTSRRASSCTPEGLFIHARASAPLGPSRTRLDWLLLSLSRRAEPEYSFGPVLKYIVAGGLWDGNFAGAGVCCLDLAFFSSFRPKCLSNV